MTGKCKPQEFSWTILSLSFSTWKGSFQHSPVDKYWITLWGRSTFLSRPLMAQMVKNLPAIQESWVPSLGQENPLEKGMATHSSILAWRIPWTEEPGQLQSLGCKESHMTEQLTHRTFLGGQQSLWEHYRKFPENPHQAQNAINVSICVEPICQY